MAKPFKKLRMLMYAEGIDQAYIAECLGRGTSYVSMRLSGIAPWDMEEVYCLCDIFDIPHDQIAEYFPREDIQKQRISAKGMKR